jgi:hypothetical protein
MRRATSSPGDNYEREADQIAAQVTRMSVAPCACGGSCPRCKQHGETIPAIQRLAYSKSAPADVSAEVTRGTGGNGHPLDGSTRIFMETRLGHDFSHVRVHTDAAAQQSAQNLNALAYTSGRDVVFAAGRHSPNTQEGRYLIAHELAHVMQQSGTNESHTRSDYSGRAVAAESARRTQTISQAPRGQVARKAAPVFGPTCSGGANDPCQLARCSDNQKATAKLDIQRGLQYVNASVAALSAKPLSDFTARTMDWYFGGHDDTTVATVKTRLACIATGMASAQFGCDPNDPNLGYTCTPDDLPICGHHVTNICFTNNHFNQDGRGRAHTAIHEVSHLEGMSISEKKSNPDIYQDQGRFLDMPPSQAMQNADSYALFATTIGTRNQQTTFLFVPSVSFGRAFSLHADPTWYYQGTLGVEAQHPRLRVFHPGLSLGITLIGDAENKETGGQASTSMLVSLLGSLRIGKSRRPGAGGGLEFSLYGGPAVTIAPGKEGEIGAVAGVAFGYRWHMLDFTVGAGYAYDPSRSDVGLQHLATVGGTFSLALH